MLMMKCPSCHQAAIFKKPNPYNLKHIGDMDDTCRVCQQSFRMEPGFYFGGAYVSYGLAVIANLAALFILYLFNGNLFEHSTAVMVTIVTTTLLIAPVVFRYSRVMFLYLFVRYKGRDKNKGHL
jgi:hypothetical protein